MYRVCLGTKPSRYLLNTIFSCLSCPLYSLSYQLKVKNTSVPHCLQIHIIKTYPGWLCWTLRPWQPRWSYNPTCHSCDKSSRHRSHAPSPQRFWCSSWQPGTDRQPPHRLCWHPLLWGPPWGGRSHFVQGRYMTWYILYGDLCEASGPLKQGFPKLGPGAPWVNALVFTPALHSWFK